MLTLLSLFIFSNKKDNFLTDYTFI